MYNISHMSRTSLEVCY